ncbi:MAG TPA: hypothetical protein PLJ38_01075 [bacterium]|nr:hypothetical protein [bacterium]
MKFKKIIIFFIVIVSLFFSAFVLIAEDLKITNEEERSEYFRNEIISNLSRQQILTYLLRKETAEKLEPVELSLRYVFNLLPPYDRKIDITLADNWTRLTNAEKDEYRYNWFIKNKNIVSTKEIQKYIIIDDIVVKAREAFEQYKKRSQREILEFDDLYSEPEFFAYVDKSAKQIEIPLPKIEKKIENEPKKQLKSKASASNKKTAAVKSEKSAETQISKKTSRQSKAHSKSSVKTKSKSGIEDLAAKARVRQLEQEMKTEIRALDKSAETKKMFEPSTPREKDIDAQKIDERMKNLQKNIDALKQQIQRNIQEVDRLKNY